MCISFDPIIPLLGISPTEIVAQMHQYNVHSSIADINSKKLGTVYMSISRRMGRQMMALPPSVIPCSCSKEWGSSAWISLERCPWWGFKWKTKVKKKKHKVCDSVKTVILKQTNNKALRTLLPQKPTCWFKYIKNCFKCTGEFARNGNSQVPETEIFKLRQWVGTWWYSCPRSQVLGFDTCLGPAGDGELRLRCLHEARVLNVSKGCAVLNRSVVSDSLWPHRL